MNSKTLSKIGVCLFFCVAMFLAECGSSVSENQPPKTERPKLVVNKWHLDTAHYRAAYRRYIDVLWEKFADSEAAEVAKVSGKEIKDERKKIEAGMWEKCNEEIAAMFFEFKQDGTYAFRYRGGAESGDYAFTPSMDSIRLKSEAAPNGYNLAVPVLSDSVMKLSMRWPMTQYKDSDERWYQVDAKYVPMK